MSQKIDLIVIDEHTLGYKIPNSNYAGVLHTSIIKGSNINPMNNVYLPFRKVRLASEKDFNEFRVVFDGYKKDPQYNYQK